MHKVEISYDEAEKVIREDLIWNYKNMDPMEPMETYEAFVRVIEY